MLLEDFIFAVIYMLHEVLSAKRCHIFTGGH
jgi:hypothetical protein